MAIRSNSRSAAIAVNPAATGTIAGDANVTYSISAVDAATEYAWTVPDGAVITAGQGTLSITVEFDCSAVPGNVAVTPSNAEGSGPPSSLAVAVAAVEAAGSITGPTLACATETNVSFSIAAVGGATTYWWTVPGDAEITGGQGTAAITVHWGSTSGEGTVTPGNANDCPAPAQTSPWKSVSRPSSPATPPTSESHAKTLKWVSRPSSPATPPTSPFAPASRRVFRSRPRARGLHVNGTATDRISPAPRTTR